MDGFGDDFVPVDRPDNEDPAAEFLAREQDELAGINDDTVVSNGGLPKTNGEISDSGPENVEEHVASATPSPVRVEPEKIRIWREKQEAMLLAKDEAEEKEKEKLRHKAKKELEEWYSQHEEQVVKTRQTNRSAEKELVADTTKMVPGTEWERISKLCDFNPKTSKSSRDVSRMRSIILQVKQNPPVKG